MTQENYIKIAPKTAFITGGSSSIGQAIITAIKASGWEIIAPNRSELDLSNLDAVKSYAKAFDQKVDLFVHVAGVWHDDKVVLAGKSLSDFTPEEIIRTMNVTLLAPMLLIRSMAKQLSVVIGISGTFNSGAKGWLPYYASKRALEDFLVGLSQNYENLKVYGISPADTATKAYKKFYPQYFNEAQKPENIAKFVSNLISEISVYKSGDIIEVRDGMSKLGFHV
jgi:NAD(P)-dependent dehydrogenase (short-subunit alcohol dehydrogenase family)